ncbi:MAG: radical SAM protein [Syntrophorhabdaceae bacterium]|nr:radical SAM protein [Syntrophorhabdaceae bacterium]
MIYPVFLPHLGCEDRCTYCDQTYITELDNIDPKEMIKKTLLHHKTGYEVGLYGGNIFGIEPSGLKALFACFNDYRDKISNFRVSTKPVPLVDEAISILKENKVTVIELGIPTFNNEILKKLNRGHTVEDLHRAYRRLKKEGFCLALQVMVGLPDETVEDIVETVENIIMLRPDYIRIYPLAIIEGTPLWMDYKEGRFIPIKFEDGVLRALYIYLNALNHDIKVVKMGLTDNEIIKEKIVGGFYHPAFGSIVKSESFYLAILTKAKRKSLKGHIRVLVNKRDIPHVFGYKRANIERLKDHGIYIELATVDIGHGELILNQEGIEFYGDIYDALEGLKNKGFVRVESIKNT